jgi:uncharacterized protein (TIGR00159 family)
MAMFLPLIQIGFLPVTIWDVLDIIIVAFLFYRIYKLLKGSVAFYILLGLLFIYVLWWIVSALEMNLLNLLLSQFVNVGVIMLLIIFQPEVRKFLLMLGSSTPFRNQNWLTGLFKKTSSSLIYDEHFIKNLVDACFKMAQKKTGALIIFAENPEIHNWFNSGISLNANFSAELLISIFNKNSPLHDGATVISNKKIVASACILPLSKKDNLPSHLGLRHRAGLGATESVGVSAIIISEENGKISYSEKGNIHMNLSKDQLSDYISLLNKTQ